MPRKQKPARNAKTKALPATKSNVVVMKARPGGDRPDTQEASRRFIIQIGRRRVALDFTSRLTELPPEGSRPAPVLPLDKRRGRSGPSQPKQSA
jgi:hypothetical protein